MVWLMVIQYTAPVSLYAEVVVDEEDYLLLVHLVNTLWCGNMYCTSAPVSLYAEVKWWMKKTTFSLFSMVWLYNIRTCISVCRGSGG